MSTKALPLTVNYLRIAAASLLLIIPANAAETTNLPPVEEVRIPTPAYARYGEILTETRRLRIAQDIDGLEALAAQLRQSKETLDGGTWLLSNFYDTAVLVPKDDSKQQAALDFYERWAKERPESITAQVCLARALTRHAWIARGSGWANSVTDEGWRLFEERLDRAWETLQRAETLAEKCPGWTEAAQTIALGQGWEPADYFKMVDAAVKQEPTYGRYYTNACYYLFPRWYGEPGDFEKWIAKQADQAPTATQDWQYARLVWMADRNQMDSEITFAPGRLDWSRTQRGFDAWLKSDPGNLMVHFQYLRLALLAKDRPTARAQLDHIGGKYFPAMWSNLDQFEAARQFAYANGPNPLRLVKPKKPASPQLNEKTKVVAQLFLKYFTQFCGGFLAGVLLLILAIQRQRVGIGVAALFVSILLGTALGTLATGLVGAALWYYFRRQRPEYPPALHLPPGWLIFIWVMLLAGTYLGLQFLAAIPLVGGIYLQSASPNGHVILEELMRSGLSFRIFLSASWLSFLLLLTLCGPQSPTDWRNRLGLHSTAPLPAVGWTALAALFVVGVGFLIEPHFDAKTREAIEMMKLGMQTPVLFFISVAIIAPILEELIFRGYAYSGWIHKIGFWGTSLLSSLIFMACHIQYGWTGLLEVFLMGMALSALRWKTGSLYPCILLHALNNSAYYISMLPMWAD